MFFSNSNISSVQLELKNIFFAVQFTSVKLKFVAEEEKKRNIELPVL